MSSRMKWFGFQKFNEHHDEQGRFAEGGGGGGGTSEGGGGESAGGSSEGGGGGTFGVGEVSAIREEVQSGDGWKGDRGVAAREALEWVESGEPGIIGVKIESGGETKGIASLRIGKSEVEVQYLATKEAGNGRAMMERVAREADSRGLGLTLQSSESAIGFYQRMGMETFDEPGTANPTFSWDHSEVQGFLAGEME